MKDRGGSFALLGFGRKLTVEINSTNIIIVLGLRVGYAKYRLSLYVVSPSMIISYRPVSGSLLYSTVNGTVSKEYSIVPSVLYQVPV